MGDLSGCRLVILNPDGTDGQVCVPKKDNVTVGYGLECDIRFDNENLKKEHFRIYVNKLGQVSFSSIRGSIFFLIVVVPFYAKSGQSGESKHTPSNQSQRRDA